MIAIVDYGVGNLFSLSSSVRNLGAEVPGDPRRRGPAGGGSYPAAGRRGIRRRHGQARSHGPCAVLREETQKKPLLGICLGMQLLFEKSCEYGEHRGLGLIPGEVCPLADDLTDPALKVPHIGWNAMDIVPGARPTRCSSTSKTASTSITYTAITPKTALHRHWRRATTASPSQARCGRGWCTALSSTPKNPVIPACGC